MSNWVQPYAEWVAAIVETLGVGLIGVMTLFALLHAGLGLARRERANDVYRAARQRLGHGILLGLELLVAADIVHTVAVELTFSTVGVLAVIVLIRTFLSFTLDVELTGRWPWQEAKRH